MLDKQYAPALKAPSALLVGPSETPYATAGAGVQGEVLGSGKVGRSRAQAAFQLRPPPEAGSAVPASLKAALVAPRLASLGPRPSSYVAELGKAPRAQVTEPACAVMMLARPLVSGVWAAWR